MTPLFCQRAAGVGMSAIDAGSREAGEKFTAPAPVGRLFAGRCVQGRQFVGDRIGLLLPLSVVFLRAGFA